MPRALSPEEKRERVEEKRHPRRERASFNGTEGKLVVGHQLDGFHLHWINDIPGRLDTALATGYTFCTAEEVGGVSVNVVSRNSNTDDTRVRSIVGIADNGDAQYAYLMKIPMEFYLEDQADLEKRNQLTDASIAQGEFAANGTSAEGRYVPKEGIKIRRE